jgi:hypothetical protein
MNDSAKPSAARQVEARVKEYWEPLISAIAGLVLAILGILGVLEGAELGAAILLVLSLLAISLIRERGLRADAAQKIGSLGVQLDETIDAIRGIQTGNPYSVLSTDATWDIVATDGSLVIAERVKKVRFDQNKVVSVYDFWSGDGDRKNEYSPGREAGQFLGEGRWNALIALDRVYYRGEHADLKVRRTVRHGFTSTCESVGMVTEDATALLCMKIQWPKDCRPTALRLGTRTPAHEWRSEDVLSDLDDSSGRPVYTVPVRDPAKGSMTVIEWEWEPVPQSSAPATGNGRPAGAAESPPAGEQTQEEKAPKS